MLFAGISNLRALLLLLLAIQAFSAHASTIHTSFKREVFGRVTELEGTPIGWNDDNLAVVGRQVYYYDSAGSLIAACPKGVDPARSRNECVVRLNADTALVRGKPVLLVRFEKIPVGVLFDRALFPIVTDHLGSVRAMFSPDGKQLLWERLYGAWGEKRTVYNEKAAGFAPARVHELESLCLWSYAGLFEVPGTPLVAGQPLYWSATRVYGPAIREWLSPDPLVKWNPATIATAPGNWHGVRYAKNRPLAYADPSGELAAEVFAVVGTFAEPGAGTVAGYRAGTAVDALGAAALAAIGGKVLHEATKAKDTTDSARPSDSKSPDKPASDEARGKSGLEELVKDFVGNDGKVKTNNNGDKIFLSADEKRRVRFDIRNPHGDRPHMHIEEKS